jgi:hypothetical protein
MLVNISLSSKSSKVADCRPLRLTGRIAIDAEDVACDTTADDDTPLPATLALPTPTTARFVGIVEDGTTLAVIGAFVSVAVVGVEMVRARRVTPSLLVDDRATVVGFVVDDVRWVALTGAGIVDIGGDVGTAAADVDGLDRVDEPVTVAVGVDVRAREAVEVVDVAAKERRAAARAPPVCVRPGLPPIPILLVPVLLSLLLPPARRVPTMLLPLVRSSVADNLSL